MTEYWIIRIRKPKIKEAIIKWLKDWSPILCFIFFGIVGVCWVYIVNRSWNGVAEYIIGFLLSFYAFICAIICYYSFWKDKK